MPKDKKNKWSWSRLFGGGRKNSQAEQRIEPARQQLEEGDLEFEVLEELEVRAENRTERAPVDLDFEVLDELEKKPERTAENESEYFGFEVLDELEQVKEVEISEMPLDPEDEIEISEVPLDLYEEIEMGEGLVSLYEEIEIAAGPLEIDIDGITDDLHIEDTFDEVEDRKESRKRREERRQARGPQERTELDDLLDELEKQPAIKTKTSMSFKDFQAEDKTERRMRREKADVSKMPLAKQKTTEKTDKKEMNPLTKK